MAFEKSTFRLSPKAQVGLRDGSGFSSGIIFDGGDFVVLARAVGRENDRTLAGLHAWGLVPLALEKPANDELAR
jgi:hypothetical protein